MKGSSLAGLLVERSCLYWRPWGWQAVGSQIPLDSLQLLSSTEGSGVFSPGAQKRVGVSYAREEEEPRLSQNVQARQLNVAVVTLVFGVDYPRFWVTDPEWVKHFLLALHCTQDMAL